MDLLSTHQQKRLQKNEIEERKEKVRILLAKWIAQEIFRRNGFEMVIMGTQLNSKEKIKRVLFEMFKNYSEIDFNSIKIYKNI